MEQIDNLVRANIRTLKPYTSAREQHSDYSLVLLDANENAWGPVGSRENPWLLNRYPDPYQRQIKSILSRLRKHPEEGIFLGNGSDEVIDLLIRVFCEPRKDALLITAPTYGMYQVSARVNDVQVIEVPLSGEFQLNASSVMNTVTAQTKIIFLCSPNNPSGNILDAEQVLQILGTFPGIVVVDEAYIDFAEAEGFMSYCRKYPRLVVMQTFSKAWGLAGIRLGVAYASAPVVRYLNRIKPPYNVNQLTQKKALEALKNEGELKSLVARTLDLRRELEAALNSLPLVRRVYPSQANFLLVKTDHPKQIFEQLRKKGIIVRDRSNVQLCEGCLRITVGTKAENQMLIDALKKLKL